MKPRKRPVLFWSVLVWNGDELTVLVGRQVHNMSCRLQVMSAQTGVIVQLPIYPGWW